MIGVFVVKCGDLEKKELKDFVFNKGLLGWVLI